VMRGKADEIKAQTGIEAFVTGTTALNIDTADTLSAALPRYVAVVVGLALVLLMIVFRSILVPLKAAAGFLLSIAASMGLVVWVFQDGNLAHLFGVSNPSPIVSFLPILLIGILFGLAMDYEVFLVSRMRESFVHGAKPRDAIVTGFGQSARVVVAAALIMIGVFGGFVLDNDPIVKSIGLSLAFGVLADAFIVRMTLVPAVMALLGRRARWLPRGLGRIVPNVDIEGEKLLKGSAKLPRGPERPALWVTRTRRRGGCAATRSPTPTAPSPSRRSTPAGTRAARSTSTSRSAPSTARRRPWSSPRSSSSPTR